MLVSFSVSNYRSFDEEATLNMVASNKLADHKDHLIPIGATGKHLVRSSLIYGANASGKTNLVQAMLFAQQLIARPQDRLPKLEFFRFQPQPASRPASFEFRFLIGDQIFTYGFDVTRDRIVAEWLTLRKGEDELCVFERNDKGDTDLGKAVPQLSKQDGTLDGTLKNLRQLPLRRDQLFLSRVSWLPHEAQGETLSAVLRWLTKDFKVLQAEHRSCELLDRLYSDRVFRRFCVEFLQSLDTGIGGLEFQETERECSELERSWMSDCDCEEAGYELFGCTGDTEMRLNPEDPSRVIVRRLLAEHPTPEKTYRLPFSEESKGTQQLLHFMPILFTPKGENKIVVIDELDSSLHPLICWAFMRFFNEHCPGARTQLIVTTHEAHLLDQQLLRRDEYWFVDKDKGQQSRLVPLSEFNIRKDLQVRKGYLEGRFGAIPILGTMEELRDHLRCETDEVADATEEAPA